MDSLSRIGNQVFQISRANVRMSRLSVARCSQDTFEPKANDLFPAPD